MKLNQWIVTLSLLFMLSACSSVVPRPDPPEVSVAGISIAKLNWREQSFDLSLTLKNPNNYRLPLRGLNYNLHLNGQAFATGVSEDNVTIAANESAKITVRISSDLLGSLSHLSGMLDGSSTAFDYAIDGSFGVLHENFKLPFQRTGTINLAPQ